MKQTNPKTYEAPKAEVIEIESQGVLCASGESTPSGNRISNYSFGEGD